MRFYVKVNLQKHMCTHSKEKPYVCDECGSSFTRGDSLKSHRFKHSGERPFKCEECSMRYEKVISYLFYLCCKSFEQENKAFDIKKTFQIAKKKLSMEIFVLQRNEKVNQISWNLRKKIREETWVVRWYPFCTKNYPKKVPHSLKCPLFSIFIALFSNDTICDIKLRTREKKSICVYTAKKLMQPAETWWNILELTLEKIPISVMNVRKHLNIDMSYVIIRTNTTKRKVLSQMKLLIKFKIKIYYVHNELKEQYQNTSIFTVYPHRLSLTWGNYILWEAPFSMRTFQTSMYVGKRKCYW